MRTVELKINDAELAGWGGVALVEMPAIEENFMAFGKQDKPEITDEYILEQLLRVEFGDEIKESHKVSTDEESTLISNKFAQELAEKMRVIGPVMRADYLIPRLDKDGNEYQVFFTADTIQKIAYKTLKEGKQNNINIEHDPENPVDGVYLVESWIVEDPKTDKSVLYGFSPNKGDWYTIYQLTKEVWDEYVKTGKVKSWSVEGFFIEKLISK
jgi:hypothetical protein